MGKYETNELPELDRDKLIEILTDELPVLRAKIGISQDDVSKIVGISRQTYCAIETKKKKNVLEYLSVITTALSGNAYKALMTGKESNVESAHLNIWSINQIDSINRILDNILYLSHPQAEMPALNGGFEKQIVTPTNLVSGFELPMVMGLPKKSVSGLAVVEMAEFGRSVVYENKIPKRSIEFGNIYHMGVVEKPRVKMDLDLLSSHCFITGSSGSGKSYATYQLLESVLQHNIKMMIIEPAKGEYKQIFGGLKGIKIFTTDPNSYRILRINPFQFPNNIHLLSHIEQLLQIFNASWPLYAAMPAILKQAVVEAYVKCGWDVQNSIWIPGICDHKYPVFADILEILPEIINHSDYSADSRTISICMSCL